MSKRTEFGNLTGRQFPRCRVRVEASGFLWVVCHSNKADYERGHDSTLYLSTAEAKLMLATLRKAVPAAIREEKECRTRKRRKWYRDMFPRARKAHSRIAQDAPVENKKM